MYTHPGMPVDTLGRFGYDGRTFNGFEAEKHPPTNAALHRVEVPPGDFVMMRNGQTIRWPDLDARRPIPQPELPPA